MAYAVDPTYAELRGKAFAWRDPRAPAGFPSGFILETGYPDAVVTLVAISDGSVSIYFSSGGGVIGAGTHANVGEAATALARQTVRFKDALPVASENALPSLGEAKLYILMNDGWRAVAGPEVDFGEGRSAVSPLFHAAHHVIAEAMKVSGNAR